MSNLKYDIIAALTAASDQAVKAEAERHRERFKKVIYNKGFAANKLDSHPKLVTIVSVISTVLAALYLHHMPAYGDPSGGGAGKGHALKKLGWSLLLGGAVSNTSDRILRHKVIDYIPIGKYVYNLGDVYIYIGNLLSIAGAFVESRGL